MYYGYKALESVELYLKKVLYVYYYISLVYLLLPIKINVLFVFSFT